MNWPQAAPSRSTTTHNRTGPGRLKRRKFPRRPPPGHAQLDAITEGVRGMPAGSVREFDRTTALMARLKRDMERAIRRNKRGAQA